MSRTLKIIFILITIFSIAFTFNYVYATSDEGEPVTTDVGDISDNEEETNIINENASDTSSLSTLSASNGTRVSTINSYQEANLQLNNILSIILISIGVLLILFAIALLIRIKK